MAAKAGLPFRLGLFVGFFHGTMPTNHNPTTWWCDNRHHARKRIFRRAGEARDGLGDVHAQPLFFCQIARPFFPLVGGTDAWTKKVLVCRSRHREHRHKSEKETLWKKKEEARA